MTNRSTGHNSGLAKGGLTCFVETFVQGSTFVLRMNFCAKNPALRQAATRYLQLFQNTMSIKLKIFVFIILSFFSFSSKALSQEINEPSYKLEFLKATYEEFPNQNPYSNQIVVYLKYSKKANEKTLMGMRFKYKINENDVEKIVNIENSKHSVTVFGDKHTKREPNELYNILKDRFNFTAKSNSEDFIFAFYLRDLTESYIPTIYFAYGLWEPSNQKIRIEKFNKIEISKK